MRRARPLLGTLVEIAAEGGDADRLHSAIDAAFAVIEQVRRLMSFHDPESDVSRLNGAHPSQEVGVNAHTSCVLRFAQELSELSNGAFDVTMAPALVEARFLPAEPTRKPVPAGTSYRDLDLLPDNRVCWRRKGWVDLGGIAKGYAVDCGIAELRARGTASGIVNAGGDLRCFRRAATSSCPASERSFGSDAAWLAGRCRSCEFRRLLFQHRGRRPPDRSAGRS